MRSSEPAPDFCLPDLHGKIHCLSDYLGKIVILNFWSVECPQSARVDADMKAYLASCDAGVTWLTIASNRNESPGQLRQAALERGLGTVLVDSNLKVADLYAAQTTPHCFLVDREGILGYQGAFDDASFRQPTPSQYYLIAALEAVLNDRDPIPDQTAPYGCTIVRHLSD
jgi:peroxiredoxin